MIYSLQISKINIFVFLQFDKSMLERNFYRIINLFMYVFCLFGISKCPYFYLPIILKLL